MLQGYRRPDAGRTLHLFDALKGGPRRLSAALVLMCGWMSAWSVLGSGIARAQQPNTDAVVLPEVVVTAPSPVVKPKRAESREKQSGTSPSATPATPQSAPPQPVAASLPQGPGAVEPSAGAELVEVLEAAPPQPLPGTLIVVDDAFVPVTVVTARDTLGAGGANVTDALASRPGITGTTFSPGSSRPIIRGLDSYRVRLQENGIGSQDVSAISEDHAVPIDPFAADRIEVIRGPATLRYGSGAIGGVVAVENERVPSFVPPGGVSGEVRGGVSSVDDSRDGAFRATAGSSGVAVHADGFKRTAEDYDTPRGPQRNSFVDSEGGALGLSRIWDEGFFGIAVARTESLYGVPGEEADEGVDPRIDLQQDKFMMRGEWRPRVMGVEAIRFWFGAGDYHHVELAKHAHSHEDDHDAHDDEEAEFEIGSRFTNREEEGRLEVQHMPIATDLGALSGAIGLQAVHRRTRGQSFEGESLLEPAQTRSLAAFLFEELQLTNRLTLQTATRIESTHVKGLGWLDVSEPDEPVVFDGGKHFVPVNASLGALYQLGFDVVMRASAQYVERAPDAAELFSKGLHEATGTFEIGNPNLNKERAVTFDLGFARAKGAFRFDAAAFYTRYRGFIYRQLTGLDCAGTLSSCGDVDEDEETFDQVLFQQRDANFYGLEIAAQYDVAPIWRGVWGVEGQYDFVRARFTNGENVPRIPPHRMGAGVFYRDQAWFMGAGILHAFDQNEFAPEEVATPGYTLVSGEVSYTTNLSGLGSGNTPMTIGVRAENLADDEVLNHASFKRREEVLEPGASIRVFGSLKLN